MERKIKRGDIYYANLNPVIGSEQGGTRPVLIISNDVGNKQMLCGKEAEVRRLCEEYNLYADLTVRVFAASNDLPELVLPDGSVAFWASVGAAVSFDFYLD